jgi:hypothetical protein
MLSVAKAIPPRAGKRLRTDGNQGVDLSCGAKYHKAKQVRPMIRIQCLFSQWKLKDLDLAVV